MSEGFDKQKMMEILVEPEVSSIISALESGEKDSIYLTEKLQVSLGDIKKSLSYRIKHGFVQVNQKNGIEIFEVDFEKLDKIMESCDNFQGVVAGLTELDQYLN